MQGSARQVQTRWFEFVFYGKENGLTTETINSKNIVYNNPQISKLQKQTFGAGFTALSQEC